MNGDILKYSKYGMSAVAMLLVVALYLTIKLFIGFMTDSIFPLTSAVNNLTVALESKIAKVEIASIGTLTSMTNPLVETEKPKLFGPVIFDDNPALSTPADRAEMRASTTTLNDSK